MSLMHLPILTIQDVVFFPHTVIPLTLDNPMAIRIVKEALDLGSPIALPYVEGLGIFGQSPPKRVCGMGVPIILEEGPNFLKILVSGIGKIKLGRVVQDIPYPIYEGEVLSDQDLSQISESEKRFERLSNILTSWIRQNVDDHEERESFCQNIISVNQVIDYLCMFLLKDIDIKQHILENNKLDSRLQMLNLLFQNHDPFNPDPLTLEVIKDYQSIELTAKAFH